MATPFHSTPADRPLLYVAKYECDKCSHKWKIKRTSGGRKNCPIDSCSSYLPVLPYEKIAIDKLVVYKCQSCHTEKKETRCEREVNEVPYCTVCQRDMILLSCKDIKRLKRKFGEFRCHKCGRNWKSGNSWEGKGQMCNVCNIMIYPFSLQPLRPPKFILERRDPHDQTRCEMCKKLGVNCKNYDDGNTDDTVARDDELPDEDDDSRSVLTDTSSIIEPRDQSFSPVDDISSGEATPTEDNGGYDDLVAEATKHLKEMKLFYKK